MNDTTRTFPRTLRDSFPHDRVMYACAIERFDGHDSMPALAWLALIVVSVVLAAAVVL